MSTKKYKDLLLQLDDMDRLEPDKDDAERDDLLDQLDIVWCTLTPEEKDEVRDYSGYLKTLWSPQEKLVEATKCLEYWQSDYMKNNRTPREVEEERKRYWEKERDKAKLACTFPTPDDLFGMGEPWDGDKATAPTGQSYWKFLIFRYKDKHTYVLENHILEKGDGHIMRSVVKRLL